MRRASAGCAGSSRCWRVHSVPDSGGSVFKLDAWHARYLPILSKAFPDVPWVFVHREPLEVLESHMRTFSYMMSAANAPAALGMPVTEVIHIPRPQHCARVLAEILSSVERSGIARSRLIDYRDLPDAVWGPIAAAFGTSFSDAEIARVRESSTYHAKRPRERFVPDSLAKREQATEEVLRAAARLEPRYRWLRAPSAHHPRLLEE